MRALRLLGTFAVAVVLLASCSDKVEPAPVTKSQGAPVGVDVDAAMEGAVKACEDVIREAARDAGQTVQAFIDADPETRGMTLHELCVEAAQAEVSKWLEEEAPTPVPGIESG